MKNKKAQYYQPRPREPYQGISPLLILGVIIFAFPMVMIAINVNIPFKFIIYIIGAIVIIFGVLHTIMNQNDLHDEGVY